MPYHIHSRRHAGINRFASLAGGVLLTVMLLFSSAGPAFAQRGVTVSFLPDPTASLTITDAASPEKAGEYQLYVPSFMAFSRLPDTFNGAVWLRISLAPSFEKPVDDLHVNFGSALPGVTRLYIPQGDGFATLESTPPSAAFTIADTEKFPEIIYARIDGTPGLWFRPVLGGANAQAGEVPPSHLLLAGLFAAAMFLLLVQYIRKAEEWRLWAAITAGCGIVAAILPANPAAGAAYTPLMAAAMLMPGLIIVFFAHTARHLFAAPKKLPGYDSFLVVYYILGAIIALLPLVPGFLYASRYLPLAFVVLLPLLFIAMVALGRSLQGATAFLSACLLTVAGVIVSAWELTASSTPLAGDLGGLAGLGFGLVLLGLTGPAKQAAQETAPEEDVFDSLDRSCPAPTLAPTPDPAMTLAPDPAPAPVPAPAESLEEEFAKEHAESPAASAVHEQTPELPEETPEEPLRLEAEETPEPAMPQEQPEPGVAAFASPAPAITILDDLPAEEIPVPEPQVAERPAFTPPGFAEYARTLFDLPMLVKEAYDEVAPLAEKKNLAMSWFIAPKTGRLFEGDKALLDSALRMLLRDMAEAMDRGNVRLNVRRLPDSKDAGHIVFTITEWDARKTFHARNMAGLSEAWALAEQTGGIFSVEHSPTSGTTVIFSSVFAAMDKPKTEEVPAEQPAMPEKAADPAPVTPIAAPPVMQEEQTTQPVQEASAPEQPAVPETIVIQPDAGLPVNEPVQKFADHPDITLPDGLEIISVSPVPAGVDGEDLVEEEENDRVPSRVIIADITASGRARMRAAFADSPYSALEGTSPQTAYALYRRNPSALVVMNGDMPEVDIAAAIRDMHAEDAEANRTPVPVLALVEYEAQVARMAQIGCAKTLMKPVENESLVAAALDLAPLEGYAPIPVPAEALEIVEAPEESETPKVAEMPEVAETPEVTEAPLVAETPPAPVEAIQSGIFVTALPEEPKAPATEAPATEAQATEPQTTEVQAGPEAKPEQPEKKDTGRGLGIIDMIVTEEEEEAAQSEAPAVAAEAPAVAAEAPAAAAEAPAATPAPAPEAASAPAPVVAPAATPPSAPKVTVSIKKPAKKAKAPSLSDPEAIIEDAPPSTTLVTDDGRPMQGGPVPSSGISIQLPGEEDSVFKDMLPLVPGLIHELTDAMADAAKGREEKSPMLVQEAAERVAGKAETFGLTRLERMARCVERAAAADDVEPMECVLDDLASWVERYKEALAKLHREQNW